MSSLAIWAQPPYRADELFRPDSPMNRDDCLAPFHELRAELQRRGWECHTQDVFQAEGRAPTDVLFLDMPASDPRTVVGEWGARARLHLLIQECEVVLPRNWEAARHEAFDRVFTWSPRLVESGGRYVEANFSQRLRLPGEGAPFAARKLATMIAGNKASSHPLELYSKRVEVVRYFERAAPGDFDLYGNGWDKLAHTGLVNKALNKVPALARAFATRYPSYRGRVEDKRSTLEQHRFAICFENARDIPGYVTEKIFDCLMAGCMPVYWGAPDIDSRIPRACFIDYREFASPARMHERLRAFTAAEFEAFLEASRAFLASDAAQPYAAATFARQLAGALGAPAP